MQLLRNSLLCLFLGVCTVAAIKFCFFLDQVSIVAADVQDVVAQAGPQLFGASLELRGAAVEQRRYYKATGKALAIAAADAARFLEHADEHSAALAHAAQELLAHTDASQRDTGRELTKLLQNTTGQVETNGDELRLTLAAARGNFEQSEKLWPPLVTGAQTMSRSSENVEQATESIRIALEPLRKPTGRLQFILHWLLGLPHVNIR